MRLKTNISALGQIYIPKKERDKIKLGTESVDYIADARAILIIPSDFTAKDAIKSLEVIQKHLEHEAELELGNKEKEKEKEKI